MKMQPVKSSNVVSVGYDPATKTMAVEFNSGTYHYHGVSADLHSRMLAAESIGGFHSKYVRGKFNHTKA